MGGKQEFSRFLHLLEFAGMSEEMGQSTWGDGQTLLVPTNAAFDKLPEDVNGRLLADLAFAQKVVQRHILDEVLCCSGIAKNNISFNTSGGEQELDKFQCEGQPVVTCTQTRRRSASAI